MDNGPQASFERLRSARGVSVLGDPTNLELRACQAGAECSFSRGTASKSVASALGADRAPQPPAGDTDPR